MSEPLIRRVNREQMLWRTVDAERLIGEDHAARAIWDLVGRLDLRGFYEGIECSAEEGGRPAFDPSKGGNGQDRMSQFLCRHE